jgi:hypothetical protein
MTVRGAPAAVPEDADFEDMLRPSAIETIPSLASSNLLKQNLATAQSDSVDKSVNPNRLATKKEVARQKGTALGTHRFTLVGKEAPAVGGKKVSACKSPHNV